MGDAVLCLDRLEIAFETFEDGFYFWRTRVRDASGRWRVATDWANGLFGGGLTLFPQSVVSAPETLYLEGDEPVPWRGRVTPLPNDGLQFEVTVCSDRPLPPPAICLWLGPIEIVNDRQYLTWRRAFIAGPTKNTQGLPGNDLPALLYYDPLTGVETVLVVDSSVLRWPSRRLLCLECREILEYAPQGRYGIGWIGADEPLPPGEHLFRWYLWQRALDAPPNPLDAAARIPFLLEPLLDGEAELPPSGRRWKGYAEGTRGNLLDPSECQVTVGELTGLRAYTRSSVPEGPSDSFELMTVADVLPGLILYNRLYPDPRTDALIHHLCRSLPCFHYPKLHYIGNRFPRSDSDLVCDTWYFFENGLIKLGWLALILGDEGLKEIVLDGLEGARRLAHHCGYFFPLFADFSRPGQPRSTGPATNPGVAGLYAYAAVQAARWAADAEEWLEEARRALRILAAVPVHLLYHEPQQLAFGAAAAARLGREDSFMRWLADRLVSAQTHMAYWFEDPLALQRGYRLRGLFQACASILYPAFKENIESVLPWTVLLRENIGPLSLMLRFLNLGRWHNFHFFAPDTPAPFIPWENLGTSEFPETGMIGKEVYGAGEVFWAALMFEALASASDPRVMVVFLDLLEPEALQDFPPSHGTFLVFNPTRYPLAFEITFPFASQVRVITDEAIQFLSSKRSLPMTLEAGAWRVMHLESD